MAPSALNPEGRSYKCPSSIAARDCSPERPPFSRWREGEISPQRPRGHKGFQGMPRVKLSCSATRFVFRRRQTLNEKEEEFEFEDD